ncbi:MAG: hypothetical protein ACRDBG_28330 [Waterburya sp.]
MVNEQIAQQFESMKAHHCKQLVEILNLPDFFPEQQIYRQLQAKLYDQCEEFYRFMDGLCVSANQQSQISEVFASMEALIPQQAEKLLQTRKKIRG